MDEKTSGEKSVICMAEYQGRCDEEGVAVGHAPKVLSAYHSMISEAFETEVFAPRCVLKASSAESAKGAKVLRHHIVMKGHNSLFAKIANKMRMFANIRSVFLHTKADKIWFFNTEFYLMLYLALFGNKGKEIYCTMFLDGYHGGPVAKLKQKIFERAQKRMKCVISSGPRFAFKNASQVFLPDYPYEEAVYTPYRKYPKDEVAVCIGTMGAEKEIEELVECFTQNGYPLHITGRFYDKERLARLRAVAGHRVIITDANLSNEEYLKMLGSAHFVVLPYRPGQYGTQTSGVLQEAVFLDTVPISYTKVLENNQVPGIGFESWEEVTRERLFALQDMEDYAKLRQEVYSRERMKEVLKKVFTNETPTG
ncbi:MAG: hypothetical protein J6N53_13215 [Lachnospiraceae bacterium]|nr:hypothetical protein [Lachnospiraceae bacterium]